MSSIQVRYSPCSPLRHRYHEAAEPHVAHGGSPPVEGFTSRHTPVETDSLVVSSADVIHVPLADIAFLVGPAPADIPSVSSSLDVRVASSSCAAIVEAPRVERQLPCPLDPLTRAGFTRGSLVFLAAHVSHLIKFVYDHDEGDHDINEEVNERDYQ
jgi:hypothetical protein